MSRIVIAPFRPKPGRARELWEAFAAACDHLPIGEVTEAGRIFSGFAPVKT